jgi:hypothetical protein
VPRWSTGARVEKVAGPLVQGVPLPHGRVAASRQGSAEAGSVRGSVGVGLFPLGVYSTRAVRQTIHGLNSGMSGKGQQDV